MSVPMSKNTFHLILMLILKHDGRRLIKIIRQIRSQQGHMKHIMNFHRLGQFKLVSNGINRLDHFERANRFRHKPTRIGSRMSLPPANSG